MSVHYKYSRWYEYNGAERLKLLPGDEDDDELFYLTVISFPTPHSLFSGLLQEGGTMPLLRQAVKPVFLRQTQHQSQNLCVVWKQKKKKKPTNLHRLVRCSWDVFAVRYLWRQPGLAACCHGAHYAGQTGCGYRWHARPWLFLQSPENLEIRVT